MNSSLDRISDAAFEFRFSIHHRSRCPSRVRVQHSTQPSLADDVSGADGLDLFRRLLARRRQVFAELVGPLRVVVGAPLAADVVEVPLSHNHKFVETLVLQTLNETLNVCPQVG